MTVVTVVTSVLPSSLCGLILDFSPISLQDTAAKARTADVPLKQQLHPPEIVFQNLAWVYIGQICKHNHQTPEAFQVQMQMFEIHGDQHRDLLVCFPRSPWCLRCREVSWGPVMFCPKLRT